MLIVSPEPNYYAKWVDSIPKHSAKNTESIPYKGSMSLEIGGSSYWVKYHFWSILNLSFINSSGVYAHLEGDFSVPSAITYGIN